MFQVETTSTCASVAIVTLYQTSSLDDGVHSIVTVTLVIPNPTEIIVTSNSGGTESKIVRHQDQVSGPHYRIILLLYYYIILMSPDAWL